MIVLETRKLKRDMDGNLVHESEKSPLSPRRGRRPGERAKKSASGQGSAMKG
jgi:hypothetical protein